MTNLCEKLKQENKASQNIGDIIELAHKMEKDKPKHKPYLSYTAYADGCYVYLFAMAGFCDGVGLLR